jgi:hypothetical protein
LCIGSSFASANELERLHSRLVSQKKALTENRNPVLIGAMKTKTLSLTLAFCFLATGACFANPFMGTWKLNTAKSKMAAGMGRNNTVVYQSMMFQTKVTVDGVDAKGKPTHSEWTGRFDGKDYAVTGDPMGDMRSYTKVNDNTMNFAEKKGGKTTLTGQIVVAPDGKSRTVTTSATNSKGKKVRNVAVYNKA